MYVFSWPLCRSLRARLAPPLGIMLDHLACNLSAAMAVLLRGGGRPVAREASDGA
jgi:hypothetical protein